MPGREVVIDWHGRRAHAWVPGPLAKSSLVLSEPTVRRTEQAAASARRVTDALPPGWAPLARLLLRTEGVASSSIEGIRAPLSDVAAAEVDPSSGEAAGWVANNLAVVTAAAAVGRAELLTTERVQDWHGRLMEGPHGWLPPEMVGAFRTVQGWIGGTSPLDAVLMTPPPEFVPDLMDDLLAYVNRDDVDAVTQAAVAHAQFESIHPYADGNGRIGRVLVAWILVRRLELAVPPPVSDRPRGLPVGPDEVPTRRDRPVGPLVCRRRRRCERCHPRPARSRTCTHRRMVHAAARCPRGRGSTTAGSTAAPASGHLGDDGRRSTGRLRTSRTHGPVDAGVPPHPRAVLAGAHGDRPAAKLVGRGRATRPRRTMGRGLMPSSFRTKSQPRRSR